MPKKTLLEASKNLHSHALESFISDATAQCQNHNFQELLHHPNLSTISKQYQALIELYSHYNYQYYAQHSQQFPALKPQQIKTLKIISLLSILQGQNFIKIKYLLKQLHLEEQQLIDFLLELNIIGTISIRIDQEGKKLNILNSQPRNNNIQKQSNSLMIMKTAMLMKKNKSLDNEISNIIKMIQ